MTIAANRAGRVAMIGQAWRTPLGRTIPDATSRLLAGERAGVVTPRTAPYACSVAAPILDEPARSRQSRFLRRMGLFGLEVAHEAFAAAKAWAAEQSATGAQHPAATLLASGDRVGLFAGVGGLRAHWDDMLAALEHQDDSGTDAWQRGLRDVHPYWMLRHLSNNVHALAAMDLGLRGEGATFGGATAGAQALAAAARALDAGAIDAALVVAYDSLLEPETLVELGARRAQPGSKGGESFIPGEAAAAIVLVRESDIASPPLAFVSAYEIADGQHDQPSAQTIERLLARVGREVLLVSFTEAMGHLGAASAVVEAIALAERRVHASVVARHDDKTCAVACLSTGAPGLAAVVVVEAREEAGTR